MALKNAWFIPWAPRERLVLLVLVIVYTAWRTRAECFRFSTALHYHQQGESFSSLLQVEQAVWHRGDWQGVVSYEISDALICITQSYGTKLITAYGFGYRHVSQTVIIFIAVCTGSVYTLTETGSRLCEGAVGDALKIFSYVSAWIGWFLVLPVIYWNLTKKLERDHLNLAFSSFVNLSYLACVCALRIWGLESLNYVNAALIVVQLAAASRPLSFHTMGFLLGTVSWYALYPSFCIEATNNLQSHLSSGFSKSLTNCLVSYLSQLLLWRLALGGLMPHSAIVVCFTIQFMEHLWSKIILVREVTFSSHYFGAACVPLVHHFLQGSLIDQMLFQRLSESQFLRYIIGDRRIVGQRPWKEVLLTELFMIKTLNNFFADILATSCIITITVVQHLLVNRGFLEAFDLGHDESLWMKLLGLSCIWFVTLMMGFVCQKSCEMQLSGSLSHLERTQEDLARESAIGTYSDVSPLRHALRSAERSGPPSLVEKYIAASVQNKYFEEFSMFPVLTAEKPALSMHVSCREVQESVWKSSFAFFASTSVYIAGQLMYDVTRINEVIT